MRTLASMMMVAVTVSACLGVDAASAQPVRLGCASEHPANAAQTLRCKGGVTIIAEDGAKFTLQDRDNNGEVDSVDIKSKALLIDVPPQGGKNRFEVTTPQAIAAVRGTKWAVDTQETRTSVLVLMGQVAVRRPTGAGQVVLGPGEGVDVERGTDPLIVKRWPEARVTALLARLGQ
jgi:FecR protein